MSSTFQVPENINFPAEEERTLKLWQKIDAFQTCLKQSKGKPRYSFYDGPPFATGLPHYGHLLAGTIKDIVTRFAHQQGFHVERRFGWDCHGLPVEYEIDKKLKITGPADVKAMGIDKYNDECRKIVMRYSTEWENVVSRLGRWIDFQNDYKTLYPSFMESVWWVFKQLYVKGFVYRGSKVMPFSTACSTPLSNFELAQNYKEVTDPAVYVSFPLRNDPSVSFIAYTTTPWTLPSNLALCVHPTMKYVKVRDRLTNRIYIMMEARLPELFKTSDDYELLEAAFEGKTLENVEYAPLFTYFTDRTDIRPFRVITADYVTSDTGTGVVHQAPYFGADDYAASLVNGIISKDSRMVCPVDATGKFTSEVADYAGMHVKEADKLIIKRLKEMGRLVHQTQITHSYPFCWRSDTPLIYKAVPSWFIRVEPITQQLIAANHDTYWVPDFVKEKKFANWLRDARDWAVSRSRYWGTPIPLWVSEDGEEVVCIGSIAELERLAGQPPGSIKDLHRETIDKLTIPSTRGNGGVLRRVDDVFDCWFESGSMPYAQLHYPFENKHEFDECFPADFIAEGIDQTRGWFYTLLVVSTALYGQAPWKNLIVNGLVLAEDGKKMSKRLNNYPDPLDVINRYGADALRLYLIDSPVVRAENLRFSERGVRDILKDVFLPWYNAYRFFMQNVHLYEQQNPMTKFAFNEASQRRTDNVMDQWILSATQSLIIFFKQEMSAYRLYTVVPRLVKFVDLLTNWYVRSNRKRLKGEAGPIDTLTALETLFSVLFSLNRLMAAFTPFLTEYMYQGLKQLLDKTAGEEVYADSIHYLMLPHARDELIRPEVERSVARMQAVVMLGRQMRERNTIPSKYPLTEFVVVHNDPEYLHDLKQLEAYIKDELNVREVTLTNDKARYNVRLKAEPNHKELGLRFKRDYGTVQRLIKELKDEQLTAYQQNNELELSDHATSIGPFKLSGDDLRIAFTFGESDKNSSAVDDATQYDANADSQVLVLLNKRQDRSLIWEGIAREVGNAIQKLRKKAALVPTDDIEILYSVMPRDSELARVVQAHEADIQQTIKKPLRNVDVDAESAVKQGGKIIIQDECEIKAMTSKKPDEGGAAETKCVLNIIILAGPTYAESNIRNDGAALTVNAGGDTESDIMPKRNVAGKSQQSTPSEPPVCPFVNIVLKSGNYTGQNTESAGGSGTESAGVVLLHEGAASSGRRITLETLFQSVKNLFELHGQRITVFTDNECKVELKRIENVTLLSGHPLYVVRNGQGRH